MSAQKALPEGHLEHLGGFTFFVGCAQVGHDWQPLVRIASSDNDADGMRIATTHCEACKSPEEATRFAEQLAHDWFSMHGPHR